MIGSKSFSQGNLDQLFLVAALLSLSIGCTVRFLVDKKIIVAIILKKAFKAFVDFNNKNIRNLDNAGCI
jgi:hypothetical protein